MKLKDLYPPSISHWFYELEQKLRDTWGAWIFYSRQNRDRIPYLYIYITMFPVLKKTDYVLLYQQIQTRIR